MFSLDDVRELWFPPVHFANVDGLLAMGGDLSPERLLLAYKNGIFPWYNPNDPILWWSPPKRMVVFPKEYLPPKNLSRFLKKADFEFTFNRNFQEVVKNCQSAPRRAHDGTWISDEILSAYSKLHELGVAKSVEVWQDGTLVGGLYGVDLGHVFCGESMFSLVSNASKSAFVWLVNHLKNNNYQLLDCQLYNNHLALLGAKEIDRTVFLELLKRSSSA